MTTRASSGKGCVRRACGISSRQERPPQQWCTKRRAEQPCVRRRVRAGALRTVLDIVTNEDPMVGACSSRTSVPLPEDRRPIAMAGGCSPEAAQDRVENFAESAAASADLNWEPHAQRRSELVPLPERWPTCQQEGCDEPTHNGQPGYCSKSCRDLCKPSIGQVFMRPTPMTSPMPIIGIILGGRCGIIGFYFPGKADPCDKLCGAGFLGNFWEVSLILHLRGKSYCFTNAESAFQATKFWNRAHEFTKLKGGDAFNKKLELQGREDRSYGGTGGNWQAMLAVLRAKFLNGYMKELLLATGQSFLLEHNQRIGRDTIWSNNNDGSGKNWLGCQLMLLRDEFRGHSTLEWSWTQFIRREMDLANGNFLRGGGKHWKDAVWSATQQLKENLRISKHV